LRVKRAFVYKKNIILSECPVNQFPAFGLVLWQNVFFLTNYNDEIKELIMSFISTTRRLFAFILFAVALVFPWGDLGHQTIAVIARQNLDSVTLARISALLPKDETLETVSTWADVIKRERTWTKPWHYIDLPVRSEVTLKNLPRYCADSANLITQLKKEIQELKSPMGDTMVRQDDLKYLVHFVEDLHLPLHCAGDDDRGGNEKIVWYQKPGDPAPVKMNLHLLWDLLIEAQPIETAETFGKKLNVEITPAEKTLWRKGWIDEWALETYGVAKNVVYKGWKPGPTPKDDPVKLDKDYYRKMRPVAEEQMKKAGVRLAYVLERIFGK
jgi:hypothetical protein